MHETPKSSIAVVIRWEYRLFFLSRNIFATKSEIDLHIVLIIEYFIFFGWTSNVIEMYMYEPRSSACWEQVAIGQIIIGQNTFDSFVDKLSRIISKRVLGYFWFVQLLISHFQLGQAYWFDNLSKENICPISNDNLNSFVEREKRHV